MAKDSRFLEDLTNHFSTFRSGEVLSQIGALCVKGKKTRTRVLMITTRDSGRWIIPKGWPIEGLQSHQVAEREAWEEAGVTGSADEKPMGYFTYLKGMGDGRRIPSVVALHRLVVESAEKRFPEKGQRLLEWLSPAAAAERVENQELKSLILSLLQPTIL